MGAHVFMIFPFGMTASSIFTLAALPSKQRKPEATPPCFQAQLPVPVPKSPSVKENPRMPNQGHELDLRSQV